jgi:hypothetical protein
MSPIVVDLTIPIENLNSEALLSEWRWLVPRDYRPIQMNKFGWWFFAAPDGSVFLLDLIEGKLSKIATSVAEFNALKNTDSAHAEWYFDGFVFRCHSEKLLLGDGQCYMWKVPPVIGGKFEFENITVASLNVAQSLLGQLFRQLDERGPGATITGFTVKQG